MGAKPYRIRTPPAKSPACRKRIVGWCASSWGRPLAARRGRAWPGDRGHSAGGRNRSRGRRRWNLPRASLGAPGQSASGCLDQTSTVRPSAAAAERPRADRACGRSAPKRESDQARERKSERPPRRHPPTAERSGKRMTRARTVLPSRRVRDSSVLGGRSRRVRRAPSPRRAARGPSSGVAGASAGTLEADECIRGRPSSRRRPGMLPGVVEGIGVVSEPALQTLPARPRAWACRSVGADESPSSSCEHLIGRWDAPSSIQRCRWR